MIPIKSMNATNENVEQQARNDSQLACNNSDRTHITARQRPVLLQGITERLRTGHGTMYITVNFDQEGQLFEVFTTQGKAGGCEAANLEGISRLVSLALRSGVDPKEIVEQLSGITCCPHWDNNEMVRSAPDAVATVVSRFSSSIQTES